MVETLVDSPALWLMGNGPESGVALSSHGFLLRNLSDFPFPTHCSDDEKRSIVERIVGALDSSGLLENGAYCPLDDVDPSAARFLAERRIITEEVLHASGPHGVYVSHDQCLSIAINGSDHLCIQAIAPGLQPQEVWARLNLIDDALAASLDFAFHDTFGYLTSDLRRVGTGLTIFFIFHLPGLAAKRELSTIEENLRERKAALHGLNVLTAELDGRTPASVAEGFCTALSETDHPAAYEALGSLVYLMNQRTLGKSEEEIVFELRHAAGEIIARENDRRQAIARYEPRQIEDHVGRALGIVRGARLLEFDEAVDLLSSLRLGVALGLVDNHSLQDVNEVLMASQRAHIQMRLAGDCDEFRISSERADLVRAKFA